jgi:hypothetical protein
MSFLNNKKNKRNSLIHKGLAGFLLVIMLGALSVVWADPRDGYRPPPPPPPRHPYPYEHRWHDREWYERHRPYYRRLPPPPVYAPPPVVYAPPPPPPGIQIYLPPIIIR